MPWSKWFEVTFDDDGMFEFASLNKHVRAHMSGIYAIGHMMSANSYYTWYVGRSSRCIRGRLSRHLTGKASGKIRPQVELKKSLPSTPLRLSVAYLETSEPKLVEAVYIDSKDRPICNIYRARLPPGLSEALIVRSELED